MIAVGLGCRKGCAADAVASLVAEALAAAGGPGGETVLFAPQRKRSEPALAEAAARLGLPLVFLPQAALAAVADRVATRSVRVEALTGLPSVSEAAAIAGAGAGGELVLPRVTRDGVACAVARGDGA